MRNKRVLIIDNFDSFTLNIKHLVESAGAEAFVERNSRLHNISLGQFSHLIIGPGPGLPMEIKHLQPTLQEWGEKPLLGVCLGFQFLLLKDGVSLSNLTPVRHGAQAKIKINQPSYLYTGVEEPCWAGLYHSWGLTDLHTSENYIGTSADEDGVVMSIQHKDLPWFGVQYHPESVMCNFGLQLMLNFLKTR